MQEPHEPPTPALRWVMVAGTGRAFGPQENECWCAKAIGYRLGREGFGLVSGGWPGVDYIVASAFARGLQDGAPGVPLSSRLLQVIPADTYPDFRGGHLVPVARGPLEWIEGLRHARAVVLVGGEGGTYETFVFATQERVPVFPVAGTGGDAAKAFQEIIGKWREIGPWGVRSGHFKAVLETAIRSEGDAEVVGAQTLDLLNQQFRFADELNSAERNNVFFSYAHEDRRWLNSVRAHLDVVPGHRVTLWDDSLIKPGQWWDDEILRRLISSAASVLLVTPAFVRSSYISDHELPLLIRQHRANITRLFWIPVEHVSPDGLGELRAINAAIDPERPLCSLAPTEMNSAIRTIANAVVDHVRAESAISEAERRARMAETA
jgi:TIR domain